MDVGREQEPPRTAPGFGRAIAASALFHAIVLGLVAWMGLLPAELPELPEPAIQTTVVLVADNPQRASRTVELPPATDAPVISPEALAEEAVAEAVPQPLPVESPPELVPAVENADAQQTATIDESGTAGSAPGITRENLNNAVAAYLASTRTDLARNWMEECQKFRNRHGVADCPQGQDTRPANASDTKKMLAETEYLRTLMDENSVVGELARERYFRVRYNYCNSNGDQQGCAGGRFTSPEGDVLTIVTFGGGGLSLLSGLVTISLKGKVDFLNQPRVESGWFSPYRERPEPEEPTAVAEDTVFRVETPLFPLR